MEQLKFLDQFLIAYGIMGLSDHQTMVSSYQLDQRTLDTINSQMDSLKKNFQISKLNLSRKNYHVDSKQLALNVLKNCLQQANVPYQIIKKSDANYLRLISPNKILMEYITHPMENIFQKTPQSPPPVSQVPIDYATIRDNLQVKLFHGNDIDITKLLIALVQEYNCGNIDNETGQLTNVKVICAKQQLIIDDKNFIVSGDEILVNGTIARGFDLIKLIHGVEQIDASGYVINSENEFPIKEIRFQGINYVQEYWYPMISYGLVRTMVTLVFPKSVLSKQFLKTNFVINYLGGVLDLTPRHYLAQNQSQLINISPEGQVNNQALQGTMVICTADNQGLFEIFEGDYITNIEATVVNTQGEKFDNIIASCTMSTNVLLITRAINYPGTQSIRIDQILPGKKLVMYHTLLISVKTYFQLSDDQYIQLTYDYGTINQSDQRTFVFGDQNQFIVKNGMVNAKMEDEAIDDYPLLKDQLQK